MIERANRHLIRHYDLTAAQRLITTAHAAIEATIAEQSQTLPKLRRRHLLMLLACKQANELQPWFTRADIMKTIKAMHLPVGSTKDVFGFSFSTLIGYQLINPLNKRKGQFSTVNFSVSRYGESVLTRLSYHHNRILRDLDSKASRRELLDMPVK